MMKKIDHLGVAVKDLAAASRVYEAALGLKLESVEEVATEGVKVAFFAIGETHIELLESIQPDGPIAKAIEKRGEGVHHIAFEVDDIHQAMANAKAQGLQLLSEHPKPGAHGTQVVFVHPKSTGGVLVEFVQKPR